jgi:hypothetical protein
MQQYTARVRGAAVTQEWERWCVLSPLELPLRLVKPVEDVDLLAPQVGVRGRVAVHPLRLQGQPLGALHHKHSHPHTFLVSTLYKEHISSVLSTSAAIMALEAGIVCNTCALSMCRDLTCPVCPAWLACCRLSASNRDSMIST